LLISKVMTNLSSNAIFDKKLEEHMCIMNEWLKKNESTYNEFIRKLINVPDPEETLGVDEFMELTQKTNPSITIHLNEMYSTHSLLLKYLHKLAPEKDDPLNILLHRDNMLKAPDELPKDQDDEIKLPLLNGFVSTSTTKTSPEQLYEQTKEAFRKILRVLPSDVIGSNVEETLEMAKQWATKKGDETSKLVLLYCAQVVEALPALVEAKKISKDNKYRQIILDITKEIQNLKVVLAKQKKEYERLQDSYASLQGHQKYLEEKVADFEEYIKKTMEAEFTGKTGAKNSKATKKHNFTFSQLEKKGVIAELKVMKSQRNQVKFTISMPTPGIFQVDAKVLNAVVSTMEIKLDDLLQKKSRGIEKMEFEHVILDVNMTLHVMNKLFVA
jgi:Ras GTPase-activating-like protein IQGAP2/3